MNALTRQRVGAGALGLVLLSMVTLFCLPLPVLTVSEKDRANQIILPMLFDRTFNIEYIHSVQKTPVQECFVLAPDNLIQLTSTAFQSLGVGTPFLPEEGTLVNVGGTYVLSGMNRKFERINLGFMPLTKHTLVYRNKRYVFDDYFKPSSLVIVHVEQYTSAEILWQMLKLQEGGAY